MDDAIVFLACAFCVLGGFGLTWLVCKCVGHKLDEDYFISFAIAFIGLFGAWLIWLIFKWAFGVFLAFVVVAIGAMLLWFIFKRIFG